MGGGSRQRCPVPAKALSLVPSAFSTGTARRKRAVLARRGPRGWINLSSTGEPSCTRTPKARTPKAKRGAAGASGPPRLGRLQGLRVLRGSGLHARGDEDNGAKPRLRRCDAARTQSCARRPRVAGSESVGKGGR
jgi:hypothetical protein